MGKIVKKGSVSIEVKPWRHPSGKDYFRASFYEKSGKRRHITASTEAKAIEAATTKAEELSKDTIQFHKLTPDVLRSIRRLLDEDPQLTSVDEFLVWKKRQRPQNLLKDAVAEFLALKEANQGDSTQNLRTLRKHLNPLAAAHGDEILADLAVSQIEAFLTENSKNGNRTRKNIRASLVTFFRWARTREYLPEGRTAAEKAETPITTYKIPETYSPSEIKTLAANVRPEYLAWLALGAFAGFRTDEICPIAGSKKSPLHWSDFQWDRELIIVRPQTAKTKRRRVVPILPILRKLLFPLRKSEGPVHEAFPPTKKPRGRGAEAETVRLGKLVGGWRQNALRHSFISYRAALVGIGQTAMEAGNSEDEVKHSYNDAKGADEAAEYFGNVLTK